MKAFDAVKEAAKNSGIAITRIGVEMGKPANYVSNGASRGSSPQCNTCAAMLDVCGYALCAVPRDSVPSDALVIDPPGDSD